MKRNITVDMEKMANLSPETVKKSIERRAARHKAFTRKIAGSMMLVVALATAIMAVSFANTRPAPVAEVGPAVTTIQDAPVDVSWHISADDMELVEKAVASAAVGETENCQQAVAQAIRQTCDREGIDVSSCIAKYQYPVFEVTVTESVISAVEKVCAGEYIINADIHYFYNPAVQDGTWHETRAYICTIGNLKFFA